MNFRSQPRYRFQRQAGGGDDSGVVQQGQQIPRHGQYALGLADRQPLLESFILRPPLQADEVMPALLLLQLLRRQRGDVDDGESLANRRLVQGFWNHAQMAGILDEIQPFVLDGRQAGFRFGEFRQLEKYQFNIVAILDEALLFQQQKSAANLFAVEQVKVG
jgi:hypothetical protein